LQPNIKGAGTTEHFALDPKGEHGTGSGRLDQLDRGDTRQGPGDERGLEPELERLFDGVGRERDPPVDGTDHPSALELLPELAHERLTLPEERSRAIIGRGDPLTLEDLQVDAELPSWLRRRLRLGIGTRSHADQQEDRR
jgi:hypothetical protein